MVGSALLSSTPGFERMKNELTNAELETYARQIVLDEIGYEAQLRIRNAHVCLIGLGGLGSPIAFQLTGMGVGTLRIVDRDIVCRSDLHRQYLYDVNLLGRPKVEAAVSRLHKLNPDVRLEAFAETFNATNAEDHIKGMDVILDGLDTPEIRYVVNRTCFRLGVPYVFGGAIGTSGNATTIVPGRTLCLECFMPGIKDDDVPKCGVLGVHPSILGVITSTQVFEAVRLIIGKEPNLLNRFLYVDLDEMMFHTLELTKREDCPVCGNHAHARPDPVPEKFFEETCARDGRRNFFISPGEKAEINLEKLQSLLQRSRFKVRSSGEFGITFDLSSHEVATILKSGGMIVQASPKVIGKPKERLFMIYRTLLVEGLGLSDQIVPEI